MSLFKRTPLYIRIYVNKVRVTNLDTAESLSSDGGEAFSTDRLVVADFNRANEVIRRVLDQLVPKKGFFPRQTKVLIQQFGIESASLSEIEKRALRDLGEMAGASFVLLEESQRELTNDEALSRLK